METTGEIEHTQEFEIFDQMMETIFRTDPQGGRLHLDYPSQDRVAFGLVGAPPQHT